MKRLNLKLAAALMAAAGAAGAVATPAMAAEEQFVEGIRAFRLTDAGLMAQADVSGIRFWRSEELNETQVAEADDVDADLDAGDRAERTIDRAGDEAEEAIDEAEDALE